MNILALRVGLAFLTGALELNLSTETDLSLPLLCTAALLPVLILVTSVLDAGRAGLAFCDFGCTLLLSLTSLGADRRGLGSREGTGVSLT